MPVTSLVFLCFLFSAGKPLIFFFVQLVACQSGSFALGHRGSSTPGGGRLTAAESLL